MNQQTIQQQVKILKKELKPDDIILIKVDFAKFEIAFDELYEIFEEIKKEIAPKKNPIFMFPRNMEVEFTNWNTTYDYLMSIKPKGEEYK